MTHIILCHFLPHYQPKKMKKMKKKHLEISSFYTSAPKLMMTHENEKTKQNEKKKKKIMEISPVDQMIPEMVPDISCTTNRWMEKVKYRGGCTT